MAHVLIMPRQGNTVESCIITNWKVKEGDPVTAETIACEVETDKASFEIPAGAAGVFLCQNVSQFTDYHDRRRISQGYRVHGRANNA